MTAQNKTSGTQFNSIDRAEEQTLSKVGILIGSKERSATMVVRDHEQVCLDNSANEFEMLSITAALAKYPWIKEKYFFKAMPADYDEIVQKCAAQEKPLGFFIYVKKGAKVKLPCQTAMYMASENIEQIFHNIIVLEDDAQLELITGCLTHHDVKHGHHLAVEEHFVGKNAKLVTTMVHSWGPEVTVYPRVSTIVDENGRYESNYISLRSAKKIQSAPKTYLNGKGASAKYLTVVLGSQGSVVDTAGDVYMNAEDTGAELIHRGVCIGGQMYQGGLLIGNAKCRAHIDCAGMILKDTEEGFIQSTPGLESHDSDARMSHEASIGKIAPEQVEYLMSRGMGEREAISLLIRGFLGAEIMGLGAELDSQIAEIAEMAGHGEE